MKTELQNVDQRVAKIEATLQQPASVVVQTARQDERLNAIERPASQHHLSRCLLGITFLAGIGDSHLSSSRLDAIWRPTLPALHFQAGLSLLDSDIASKRLLHEAVGFITHTLL